ncbi:MAG: hypothetical protein ACMG6S_25660 [Byssovorax sp.]
MREQWIKGLTWGAALWLVWLAGAAVAHVVDDLHTGLAPDTMIPAIGWTVALVLQWTRFSRLGAAVGIAAHVYAALAFYPPPIEHVSTMIDGVQSESYLDLMPLLRSFVPECLPMLPLLFMAPKAPRYVAALALVGRWYDAAREMTGIRWVLVAAGLLTFHTAFPDVLVWWTFTMNGVAHFRTIYVARQLLPCALLLGAAAISLPRVRVSARP